MWEGNYKRDHDRLVFDVDVLFAARFYFPKNIHALFLLLPLLPLA